MADFTIEVDDSRVNARLQAMPTKVRAALQRKRNALLLQLEALVKQKLSNQVLHVRSGALRRSIHGVPKDTAVAVAGSVVSSADVKYARIQELGGKTSAHDIVPVKAKALHFVKGGKDVFAKIVHHPGSNIPAHYYLRDSLREMTPVIREEFAEAVREGAKE